MNELTAFPQNSAQSLRNSEIIRRIAASASILVPPNLQLMKQLHHECKAGLAEERAELLQRRMELRAAGFAAATRLMAPSASDRRPYFERVHKEYR